MSEIQLAHFSWGESPSQGRIHDVALRDARIATEARGVDTSAPRPSLADRLGLARFRLALAGGPAATTDPCGCAA
jgi:hypothetical protein